MSRLTSGWTDRHVLAACALLTAALAGGLALRASSPYDAVGIGAVAATVLLALRLDPFGGIVGGFTAAAALIAARQAGGQWARADFGPALATTAALVALGWVVGLLATRLRTPAGGPTQTAVTGGAYGSLGLLSSELALARLDEEVVRARRHHRPVTVVLLSTEIVDPALPPAARTAAWRTVARLMESLVPETSVPFALSADEVGAILPETDEAAAWQLLGPVIDAAGRASFTVREQGERRSLADCVELYAGLVPLSAAHSDADQLLAELRHVVPRNRPAQPRATRGPVAA